MNYKKATKKITDYNNRIRETISLLETYDIKKIKEVAECNGEKEDKKEFQDLAKHISRVCNEILEKRQQESCLETLSKICSDYAFIGHENVSELQKRAQELLDYIVKSVNPNCDCVYKLAQGVALMLNNEMHKDDFSDVEFVFPEQIPPEQSVKQESSDNCPKILSEFIFDKISSACKELVRKRIDYKEFHEKITDIIVIDDSKDADMSYVVLAVQQLASDVRTKIENNQCCSSIPEDIVVGEIIDFCKKYNDNDNINYKELKSKIDRIVSIDNDHNSNIGNIALTIQRLVDDVISADRIKNNFDKTTDILGQISAIIDLFCYGKITNQEKDDKIEKLNNQMTRLFGSDSNYTSLFNTICSIKRMLHNLDLANSNCHALGSVSGGLT